MLSAWLLPEHIADVLPAQARHIEALRRHMLDTAQGCGFELVIPPLLEHLDALLSGTGHELDLSTFKLVDQLSGRLLGVRADTTPQAARIDAHLLNRQDVTRLCYCGPVLHTRPTGLAATREPLQFGAELFGHDGLAADLEVAELALDCLQAAGVQDVVIDLADARLLRGVLAGAVVDADHLKAVVQALSSKDAPALASLGAGLPGPTRDALMALLRLYGDDEVLTAARRLLPERRLIHEALDQLRWLAGRLRAAHPGLQVGFDLSDMSGYSYYSGVRFAIFAAGSTDSLARGGRYDEVGAIFGRNRPAVGFSLDLKSLVEVVPAPARPRAVRAPGSDDPALQRTVRELRAAGHIVAVDLTGHAHLDTAQGLPFDFDRELVRVGPDWQVRPVGRLGRDGSTFSLETP